MISQNDTARIGYALDGWITGDYACHYEEEVEYSCRDDGVCDCCNQEDCIYFGGDD